MTVGADEDAITADAQEIPKANKSR